MRPIVRQLLNQPVGFSPRQLFTALQGAWLEPIVGNIWQENTGVTPTTTGGQTIGLMLDQSQGAILGPELAANISGFTSTVGGGTLLGALSFASSGAGGVQRAFLTVGRAYALTLSYTQTNAVELSVNNFDAAKQNTIYQSSSLSGSISTTFFALTDRLYLRLAATSVVTITSISVKQILGNHGAQSVSGSRPTYQLDSNGLPLARHDATDSLSVSLPAINVRRNLLTNTSTLSSWIGFNNPYICEPGYLDFYGRNNAIKITAGSLNSLRTSAVVPSTIVTFSFAVKGITSNTTLNPLVRNNTTSTNFTPGSVNVLTGAVTGSGWTSTSLGNGWFFVSFTASTGISSGDTIFVYLQSTGALTSNDVFLVAWPQLELGSVATDYQRVTDWTSEAYSSSGSVYFSTPVGMSALHGQSMGTTYQLPALSTDIYSWIVVPQRLNTAQENRLARYMERKAGIAGPDYFEQEDYGPELIEQPINFATWTATTGGTPTNTGTAFTTFGAAGGYIKNVLTAGKNYIVSISGTTTVSGGITLRLSNLSASIQISVGFGTAYFTVPAGYTYLYIRNEAGGTTTITSVSVRELKDGMTGQLFADDGTELLLAQ